jgi:hypothetical protein
MRNGRLLRRLSLLAAVTLSAVVVAGCGDDGDGESGSKLPTGDVADRGDDSASQGDACALLDDAALESLFPDGVPDPSGTSMGEGFAECEWGTESDGPVVLLSTLPASDFQSDYVDQLNVTAPVTGIGDRAVSFPGFVGIGRGSAGGGSVGFAKGDRAALVAVRSSGEPSADAGLASDLAGVVAGKL